ncbi:NAD(P)H-binding protein, partial [Streptosporangiaceae bacterium NEAU-GS5]|nr:NAD(P)H-binding protein [Streptosporangiaceae bacterium NEAU-GS5]
MFTYKPWMLYGATGRTGTLIAERAVAAGHRPLLAGRDAGRLRALAGRLDLPWVAAAPDDLDRAFGDSQLVLLAAGPFESTSRPVLDASLRAGVHYLDIANEIGVIERVLQTRTERITAMPAVGFGTVASDGLARQVADQVPGAGRLEIAILLGTAGSSAGARASRLAVLAGGGQVRRDGRLVRTRLGYGTRSLTTPVGVRTAVPVPTGDLVVSYHTTAIPDITVSTMMTLPAAAARVVLPALPAIARTGRRLSRLSR